MAKHPTPKRKLPKSDGRKRYSHFQYRARKRLSNLVNLVKCSNCSEMRRTHHLCHNCGFYRGRKVLDMTKKLKREVKTVSA